MGEHKHSRQREIIRQLLYGRTDHPTADQLYEEAKVIYPSISMGTIYRNLAYLSEIGEIQRIPHPGGADRYDSRPDPHFHFVCTSCGGLQDVGVLSADDTEAILSIRHSFEGGQISGFTVIYSGLCCNCLRKR